jgi:cysteine desulfurase family protein (TIGR01976 family)
MIAEARAIFADFFNAPSSGEDAFDEIAFGLNFTSHTFNVSRSIGKNLKPGDELMVTVRDHEANHSPWVALDETGATIHEVDINPEDCTLDMADFESKLSERTKVVAIGCASNFSGNISDIKAVAEMAHQVGAIVYADAVHYAPHAPIDVQDLGVDFLAISVYKVFGPHGVGVLYGKKDVADKLPAYKVRPCTYNKFESGTQTFCNIPGAIAAMEYIAELGKMYGAPYKDQFPSFTGRRLDLKTGMAAIRDYEMGVFERLMNGVKSLPGIKVYGITDPKQFHRRTPTLAMTVEGFTPYQVGEYMAKEGIFIWTGNFYAQRLDERLGTFENGGVVRVGLSHYNTEEEIDRYLKALETLIKSK